MITREETGGVIGTILFTVLLFLIMLFSFFTLSPPSEEPEGVPVMFGTVENASGASEPLRNEVAPAPVQSPEVPPYSPTEPMLTQHTEPTIDVEARREEERRKAQLAAEQRAQEEAERRRREEEARSREINRQMSGLFGEGAASRGGTEGEGTQGVSTGNSAQGASAGIGGMGSFDLGGRSLGSGGLVQPRYNVNDEGRVVVNITVDPEGTVVGARIGAGSTTGNSTLRNEALEAAKRTKFNAINATTNQEGTITYNFRLK